MLKKYSLKKQFILTFALVLGCSIISVILTACLVTGMLNGKSIKAANYYEKKIYDIEKYINTKNDKLLNLDYEKELNKIIPSEGIRYRVAGLESNKSYGNLDEKLYNQVDIVNKINTSDVDKKNNVTKYIPIVTENYQLKGAVILSYRLAVTSDSIPQSLISLITFILLISPFIYIVFFSYLFGKILSKNINDPLSKLKHATENIKENNLDFNIEYPYNNELGEVISSFEEMKNELKNTLNKQWNMEEERKEIISGLSHDLRSPLTIIKGKVEMLLEGSYKNEDRLISYLHSINKSTDRSIELVNDLNLINKLDSSDFNINPTSNNVINFLNQQITNFKDMVESKQIKIKLITENIQKDLEYTFDKNSIIRVMDNIISNAIRHTDLNGEINIKVTLYKSKLYFKISDNGNGFSNDDLKFALNKFYRGDKSRSAKSGNSGLGLYICKAIVEKHNGEINISNNSLGGAQVSFYLKFN